jgi:hypothetical protein
MCSVERQTWQKASLSLEPSQYGFAVMWNLEGAEPAVVLHRQAAQDAEEQLRLNAQFLVEAHGWELDGVDGSTIYFKRRTLHATDQHEHGGC